MAPDAVARFSLCLKASQSAQAPGIARLAGFGGLPNGANGRRTDPDTIPSLKNMAACRWKLITMQADSIE